ncbi:MAG: hypothetical protein HY457_00505 [Parcubacteria group bacterium]|nr:hypothetical protein [Parcubacteria group bacterium]
MGGSGTYYDGRDVTSKALRVAGGFTTVAQRDLSRSSVDASLLPKDRKLICEAKDPLVYFFDVTGSMGKLPKIIYDKWPGIVGQIVARRYLLDPQMSLAAVGDTTSDDAPLQMADFSVLRNLDRFFKKIYFEGKGGAQHLESYEVAAYFYAYLCDFPNAETPICLFTGDEGFREELYADDLCKHFGGQHKDTTANNVFRDLLKKFKGNVLLIHRYYPDGKDSEIVRQWRRVLGEDRVILMPKGDEGDLAIGDITLGVYAVVSGARTLPQYLEDMRTRPLNLGQDVEYEPQSPERIRQVEKALEPLKNWKPVKLARSASVDGAPKKSPAKEKESKDKKRSKGQAEGASWKL